MSVAGMSSTCEHVTLIRQNVGRTRWYKCVACEQEFLAKEWDGAVRVVGTSSTVDLLKWAIRIVHCSHDGPSEKCLWPFCKAANLAMGHAANPDLVEEAHQVVDDVRDAVDPNYVAR